MWWWLCLFSALVFSYSSSYSIRDLPLNSKATLLSEVKSVRHNQTSQHIIINLAENRRCVEPTFMVRLSGSSLYLLELVHNNHTKSEVIFRYPPLHDAGLYFLEVLTVYCEPVNPNAFANLCVVNPQDGKNILTLPYSFHLQPEELDPRPRPRWVLHPNATSALLSTRYQKMCSRWAPCVSVASEIAQHNQYEWTDKPLYEHLVRKTLEMGRTNITHPTGSESITICMVGASHAREIAAHGQNLTIPHVNFWHVYSTYPQLFDISYLTNCTYTVVGYGQWPLSHWMNKEPYNAERFEFEMRNVLGAMRTHARTRGTTQYFVRSMNLNGLSARHTECPADDYRSPPLVTMYNSILSKLCAEYSIPFIDMFHLQGPLWDIALDWSHPRGRVLTAEAEYILHTVLTHSHKHHTPPHLDPDFAARPPHQPAQRIKFTDLDTVYLMHMSDGVYRALPNKETAYHLGHPTDENVVVYDAARRSEFRFGADIPDI